jgi:hypothetical protein
LALMQLCSLKQEQEKKNSWRIPLTSFLSLSKTYAKRSPTNLAPLLQQ